MFEEDKLDVKRKFFQAILQENLPEVTKLFQNSKIFPWEFTEEGGYTGKK